MFNKHSIFFFIFRNAWGVLPTTVPHEKIAETASLFRESPEETKSAKNNFAQILEVQQEEKEQLLK